MTKEEAIKYLQQLYPNGGNCWLDEQRIEAIGMAIKSLTQEPVSGLDNGNMPIERWKQAVKAASNQGSYRSSKGLTETRDDYFVDGVQWADEHPKEEPVIEDLEEAAKDYSNNLDSIYGSIGEQTRNAFKAGAKWGKNRTMAEIQAQSMALAHGCPKESITEN